MKEFNELCKIFEEADLLTYSALLTEKSVKVLPALSAVSVDGLTGVEVYASFIIASVVADGKLSEEEYALLYPSLHVFFGDNIDYESCKKAVRKISSETRELKKLVNEMVDVLGHLSDSLKDDIIVICMLICAIDGKISLREKMWIKQLIKD
ncbi:MAG: hypothetical protein K6F82_01520 [Sphaerochaetaceae bacterium]|nr:hypothetical protein [Sphaerochaetaceae bacterium]